MQDSGSPPAEGQKLPLPPHHVNYRASGWTRATIGSLLGVTLSVGVSAVSDLLGMSMGGEWKCRRQRVGGECNGSDGRNGNWY